MEAKKIKCPNCGFKNVYGTKKCFKCKKSLVSYISCPKCAKKNAADAKKCSSCGFDFKRKRLSIFACLIISLLICLVLYLCVRFGSKGILGNVKIVYYIFAVIIIMDIVYSTLTYGRKDQLKFDAEEEMSDLNPRLQRMKLISIISIVVMVLAVAFIIIYKYILKK